MTQAHAPDSVSPDVSSELAIKLARRRSINNEPADSVMDELESMLDAPDFEVSPVKAGGTVRALASQLDGASMPTVLTTAEQAAKIRENEMLQNRQAKEFHSQSAGEESSWQKCSRDAASKPEPVFDDCVGANEPSDFKLEPAPLPAAVKELAKQLEVLPPPQQPGRPEHSSCSRSQDYDQAGVEVQAEEQAEEQGDEQDCVLDMLKEALQGLDTGKVYREDASPPKPAALITPKRADTMASSRKSELGESADSLDEALKAEAEAIQAWFSLDFENQIIRWKQKQGLKSKEAIDRLGSMGSYERFLAECYSENIAFDGKGKVRWIDPRVQGDDWRGVFESLEAQSTLHAIGASPGTTAGAKQYRGRALIRSPTSSNSSPSLQRVRQSASHSPMPATPPSPRTELDSVYSPGTIVERCI
jgi:hypothetical protein